MKPLTLIIALSVLLAGCGTLGQSVEESRRVAELVGQRLDNLDYRIEINYMAPFRGPGRVITDSYSISVDGSVINSHLPYVGTVYSVPYGGGKVLTFKDDIDEYADSGWSNGQRKIVFSTNNDEDTIIYTLIVSDNASVDIRVRCRNREDISYRGTLVTDEDDEE